MTFSVFSLLENKTSVCSPLTYCCAKTKIISLFRLDCCCSSRMFFLIMFHIIVDAREYKREIYISLNFSFIHFHDVFDVDAVVLWQTLKLRVKILKIKIMNKNVLFQFNCIFFYSLFFFVFFFSSIIWNNI